MALKTAREIGALRRSSRLAASNGSEESLKTVVRLSTRRTTGQLRLPSTAATASKRGVKKRSTAAGRRSKSMRWSNSSVRNGTQVEGRTDETHKLTNHDICREIPLHEPVNAATKDCIYCCPESTHDRCCHNRGQPVPKSPGSALGPNVVLTTVETDDKPVRLFRGGHPISREEEQNVQGVLELLAKRREQDRLERAAAGSSVNEYSRPTLSVSQNGSAMVKPELPTIEPPTCIGSPGCQSGLQKGRGQARPPLQSSHVRFLTRSTDSLTSGSIASDVDKDTERWKKKLALCEPLQIPQYRPPTPYPDADMVSPASDSPDSPKPVSVSDIASHSYFTNNPFAVATKSGASTAYQQKHPTPTGLGRTKAYRPKEWSALFGTDSRCSLTSLSHTMPLLTSSTGNLAQGYTRGLQVDQAWRDNKAQSKALDVPELNLQPPTPILRARQLPDYAMYPPHSSFM